MTKTEFDSLKVLDLVRGKRATEYEQIVQWCRDGTIDKLDDEILLADIIVGPTARQKKIVGKDGLEWTRNTSLPVQYCFRTQMAVDKLRPETVYPCDVWYEEKLRRKK